MNCKITEIYFAEKARMTGATVDNDGCMIIRKISANYYKDKLKLVDWTYAGTTKRDLINQGLII